MISLKKKDTSRIELEQLGTPLFLKFRNKKQKKKKDKRQTTNSFKSKKKKKKR
jgi:hypothetical protein